MNYKATCIYDDMTVVIENGAEISRVYQDNRTEYAKECFEHGGIYPLDFIKKGTGDMNRHELADRLEELYTGTHITEAANLIRYQDAKIKMLEAVNARLTELTQNHIGNLTKIAENLHK